MNKKVMIIIFGLLTSTAIVAGDDKPTVSTIVDSQKRYDDCIQKAFEEFALCVGPPVISSVHPSEKPNPKSIKVIGKCGLVLWHATQRCKTVYGFDRKGSVNS